MLQAIRDKTTGWIAYLIIFLISVPFALWGVNSYLGGGEAVAPATVNGEDISLRNLDTAYTNYRQRLADAFGGAIPTELGNEALLKDQVLNQLIQEYALRQYADAQGYRVGDEQLNNIIRSMDVFKTDGQFDSAVYEQQLSSLGYSPLGFEQEFRRSQSVEQLEAGIAATAFVTPAYKKQLVSLTNQTRKIRVLSRPKQEAGIEVSEQEIEGHFNQQASFYMTPEQVKIDYIELDIEGLMSSIDVTEEQLLDRYEQVKDSYTTPEYRVASHILLTLDSDASDDADQRLKTQLTEIRQKIVNGADFATLAREFSQDPGSANEGGDLGEIERGTMVEAFETALFAMEEGDLSEPVKTSFGWHLIKLNDISGGKTQSYEEVKMALAEEMKTEAAEGQIFDLVESLANITYEQPDSLDPAAEQHGLQVKTSDWFDASTGEGIAAEPKVRNIAFSEEILHEGRNSEVIELASNRAIFLRLNEHKPATQKSVEQVRDSIIATVKQKKARIANSEAGKEALKALQSGRRLEDVAAEWNIQIIDAGFVNRNNRDIDADVLNLAFSMQKPDGKPVFNGIGHASGDYSLIELSAVLSNDSNVDDGRIQALAKAESDAEYQSILKLITNRAEVVKAPLDELLQ